MRISDWSSDVCSSDLGWRSRRGRPAWVPVRCPACSRRSPPERPVRASGGAHDQGGDVVARAVRQRQFDECRRGIEIPCGENTAQVRVVGDLAQAIRAQRSEEHTSELQSLMRISYAVFCLKKKQTDTNT